MESTKAKAYIQQGGLREDFRRLYGSERLPDQERRYLEAIEQFEARFGCQDIGLFSAPGRTELSGNHTDHNGGCVLAASVDLDVIAVAAKTNDRRLRIVSEGYPPDDIDLADLRPQKEEINRAAALIRGVAAGLAQENALSGGVCAYTTSQVPSGSGLSSSAAFEVLLAAILQGLYGGHADPVVFARMGQQAENAYFGKPSGLMDQLACAVGGCILVDFADAQTPHIQSLPVDFGALGYTLCIVETGGSHADLTGEYAAIPAEMRAVAGRLGGQTLSETEPRRFFEEWNALREAVGDRAVLRAYHFFQENRRVMAQAQALQSGNMERYLHLVRASGRSSGLYLQNLVPPQETRQQGLTLAMALSEWCLGPDAALRVHGGGFAGTIQVYVPHEALDGYRAQMERVFGKGCCHAVAVRPVGVTRLL